MNKLWASFSAFMLTGTLSMGTVKAIQVKEHNSLVRAEEIYNGSNSSEEKLSLLIASNKNGELTEDHYDSFYKKIMSDQMTETVRSTFDVTMKMAKANLDMKIKELNTKSDNKKTAVSF